ncbi:MAG: hypothetical protein II997_00155 [Clostridia bacterium]|nr:hypothetical protein [Clostridia bacterium]
MKKVLSVVLVLLFSVSLLAGCGSSDAGTAPSSIENSAETNEEAATKAAEHFIKSLIDLDVDSMRKTVVNPERYEELFSQLDVNVLIENLLTESPEMAAYKEPLAEIIEYVFDKMMANADYTINETKKDGKNYIVSAEITLPELGDFDSIFETAMGNTFSDEKIAALIGQLFVDGKVTNSSSEEDIMNAVMSEILSSMKATVDSIEIKTETYKENFVACNENGTWLIDLGQSEIE